MLISGTLPSLLPEPDIMFEQTAEGRWKIAIILVEIKLIEMVH